MEINFNDSRMVQTADLLAQSVEVILSPSSPAKGRAEAQIYYDNLRSNGKPQELCTIGFMLSSASSPRVVHAGLQFIQHAVCYSWDKLTVPERCDVKRMFMDVIRSNPSLCQNSLYALPYIQESLAKVIVEIAKKEWPQLWPELIEQLKGLTKISNVPFLVIRRLVEDVISLNTVDSYERRAELMQSLNFNANEVVNLLFETETESIRLYLETKDEFQKQRLLIVLSVICSYFEWVNTSVILTGRRIWTVVMLLQMKEFKYEACQCLLQLMERKGTKKETEVPKEILEDCCSHNIVASIRASGFEEEDIKFLQRLGEVLVLLGSIIPLNEHDVGNFEQFIMAMASHGDAGSLVSAAQSYINFLKNVERQITEPNQEYTSQLKELISIICRKFISPVNPAEKTDMNYLKQHLSVLLKHASKIDRQYYLSVNTWYHESLNSALPIAPYQWDIIAFILDVVASSIDHENAEILQIGLNDLRIAVDRFNAETDLMVKSSHLSIVSALFVFLNLVRERGDVREPHVSFMNSILTSMFSCFAMEEFGEPGRFLRHHVASLMVKLGTRFPVLLDLSLAHIHGLFSTLGDKMRHPERQSVMECAFMISNTWKDYGRQKQLVESTFRMEDWAEMDRVVQTPETFVGFFEESVFMQKRSLFSNNFSMLFATIRRVQSLPSSDGKDERVHPAYEICRQFLLVVFQYAKILYAASEVPILSDAFAMTEAEKIQVLGIMQSPASTVFNQFKVNKVPNEVAERNGDAPDSYRDIVKKFIHSTTESVYGILGGSCLVFSPQFYGIPRIQEAYLSCWKVHMLSDIRIRNIIRTVYRPFLISCPAPAFQSAVIPFMQKFAPDMKERLSRRWAEVEVKNETSDDNEDEANEILETSILRLLTREYLEIVQRLLERSSDKSHCNGVIDSMDVEMDDDESMAGPSQNRPTEKTGSVKDLGELGAMLLKDPTSFQAIIYLCGLALNWNDSGVCYRAGRCLLVAWEPVAQNPEVVLALLINCLRCICTWLDMEANMDVLVRLIDLIYKTFHKQDSQIVHLLMEWGAPEEELRKLTAACADGVKNERKRKEIIRRLAKNNPNMERNKVRKSSWLDKLPPLAQNKWTGTENTGEIDLTALFSLVQAPSHN